METVKRINLKKIDILWFFSFLLFFSLILYKCKFGFAFIDESFYIATPYKFSLGARVFVDEWDFSQMSSFMLLPFMKIYLAFFESTEGILLAFRYIFTIVHSITALWIYIKLRDNKTSAWIASIVYLLFVPFGIMALSYNSMGVALMTIACVILYSNKNNKPIPFILAGISFAYALLCCPYLIIAYVLFGIICIAMQIFSKKGTHAVYNTLNIKTFCFFTCGCAIAAVLFIGYIVANSPIDRVIENVTLALNLTSHLGETFSEIVSKHFISIFTSNIVSPVVFFMSGILLLVIFFDKTYFDKEGKKRRGIYFLIALVITGIYIFHFFDIDALINNYMFPLNLLGFFCLILYPQELIRPFAYFWLPGIVYGFCLDYTSTQQFLATADGTAIATIGSIIMIVSFVQIYTSENKTTFVKNIYRFATGLLLVSFVFALAVTRYERIFWETSGIENKTAVVSVGAEKGIHTTQKQKEYYEALFEDTQRVRDYDGELVLYYTSNTWLYLNDNKRNACFSTWSPIHSDVCSEKLFKYYSVNPENLPNIVYFEKANGKYNDKVLDYFIDLGYEKSESKLGIFLVENTKS